MFLATLAVWTLPPPKIEVGILKLNSAVIPAAFSDLLSK
jgi:hypothetical protein